MVALVDLPHTNSNKLQRKMMPNLNTSLCVLLTQQNDASAIYKCLHCNIVVIWSMSLIHN